MGLSTVKGNQAKILGEADPNISQKKINSKLCKICQINFPFKEEHYDYKKTLRYFKISCPNSLRKHLAMNYTKKQTGLLKIAMTNII